LRTLIIEDDAQIVEAIKLCLQLRWPEIEIAAVTQGGEGIGHLQLESFDVVILDINLPDISGFEVLQQIRRFSDIPVLILTVRDGEDDQIRGLEMGADDYIVKPFRPRDLTARINAIVRRTEIHHSKQSPSTITTGKLSLDLRNNKALIGGEVINLTPTESKVLYSLIYHAGSTLSTEKIIEEAWGTEKANAPLVRTYIKRLRDKLKNHPTQIILNERGDGYRFVSH
jgi:DNA-binding response OmpR family regulator